MRQHKNPSCCPSHLFGCPNLFIPLLLSPGDSHALNNFPLAWAGFLWSKDRAEGFGSIGIPRGRDESLNPVSAWREQSVAGGTAWGRAWQLPALGPAHFGFCPAHPTQRGPFQGQWHLWEGQARCYHEGTEDSVNSFIASCPAPSARRSSKPAE